MNASRCATQIVLADVDGGASLGRATEHVRWHALRASARVRKCPCCACARARVCGRACVRAGLRSCACMLCLRVC